MKYYAIAVGRKVGIFTSWEETKNYVSGFPNCKYKSFPNIEDAKEYLQQFDKKEGGFEKKLLDKVVQNSNKLEVKNICCIRKKRLICYTDGSCVKKSGGYGFVYLVNGEILKYKGPISGKTTNQVAELYAIYKALETTEEKHIDLYTDSKYSIGCCTEWFYNWKNNGWKNSKGETIANLDLIKSILLLLSDKDVRFFHVFGHTGNEYNELCDKLANEGRSM